MYVCDSKSPESLEHGLPWLSENKENYSLHLWGKEKSKGRQRVQVCPSDSLTEKGCTTDKLEPSQSKPYLNG